tara:strand:- start:7921 stop:8325 length:405 start_codon:yes stop_codon:yes gene_type:complete
MKYNCVINRVVDGDTIDVDIDLGFDIVLKNKRVRLAGLDAPESRTSDKKEDYVGEYVRDLLTDTLQAPVEAVLSFQEHKRGKYGRIIGDLCAASKGFLWSSYLLDRGLVLPEDTAQADKTIYWHKLYKELHDGS